MAANVFAFQLSNKAKVSIITCSPGNEMYSVYGHSAIRVHDPLLNYDVAFNYGIFDFSSPNFLYRFAAGQTDYLLGAYRFNSFLKEYKNDKRSVFEQELNLSAQEKQNILDFLLWNARPENRVYRYNFFFDNCATRVRDVIAQNVVGGISYTKGAAGKTLRTLIKDYHGKLPWLNFGIDFLVSADSDREATLQEEMFLPDYVMQHFASAKRNDNGNPITKPVTVIYKAPEQDFTASWLLRPLTVVVVLFFVIAFATFKQYKNKRLNVSLDILLFGLNGLGGLLLTWFTIYSEHPAMSPNYNLLWLVPVNLLFALLMMRKKWRSVTSYYHLFYAAWMIVFVAIAGFLQQKFHPVFFVLCGILFIRSLAHAVFTINSLHKTKG